MHYIIRVLNSDGLDESGKEGTDECVLQISLVLIETTQCGGC